MRVAFRGLLAAGLFSLCAAAHAQQADCTVLGRTATSGLHPSGLVVTPGKAVTLEAHCNYPPTTYDATFLWSTGGTTFSKVVNAPSTPGTSTTFTLTVSQAGGSRAFQFRLAAADAGTPICTITRTVSDPVLAFTPVTLTASCDNAQSYHWAGGYDVRNADSAVATVFNVLNASDLFVPNIDLVASNAIGAGAMVESNLHFATAPPSCRIIATPAGLQAVTTPIQLEANCDGAATGFTWSTGESSRAIQVTPSAAFTEYTVNATNAAGTGQTVRHAISRLSVSPPVNLHTAHWWGGASENGWGVTLNEHGSVIFGVIYYYDPSGRPTWAVMPGGTWDSTHTIYSGDLFVPAGAPYTNYDAGFFFPNAAMGNIALEFAYDGSLYMSGNMGYAGADSVGPHTTRIAKKLSPLVTNTGTNPAGANYGDMWWGGSNQNGWGISINQSANLLFAAWFTYAADHRPTWFIFQGNEWSGSTVSGIIYRTQGAPMLGVAYNAGANVVSVAGTGTMTFSAPDHGVFNYTIDGVAGSKAIEKQPY